MRPQKTDFIFGINIEKYNNIENKNVFLNVIKLKYFQF